MGKLVKAGSKCYTYKGTRYTREHVHNNKLCIYSKKEKAYIPINSKKVSVLRGGNPSDEKEDKCILGKIHGIPKDVMDILVKKAYKDSDFAGRMRLYLTLNMREAIQKHKEFMVDYIIEAIKTTFSEKVHSIRIWQDDDGDSSYRAYPEEEYAEDEEEEPFHPRFVYDFKKDNNDKNMIHCSVKNESERDPRGNIKIKENDVVDISELGNSKVVQHLISHLLTSNWPGTYYCRMYNKDDRRVNTESEVPSILRNFGNNAYAKMIKYRLGKIKRSSFLEDLKEYTGEYSRIKSLSESRSSSSSDGSRSSSSSDSGDEYEKGIVERIENFVHEAEKAVKARDLTDYDMAEINSNLHAVQQCMMEFKNNKAESIDQMWEYIYPIPYPED